MTELSSIQLSMDAVEKREQFRRLPTTVVPQNYKIKLTPNLETFTFLGQLLITVQVQELTNSVVLNCSEIEIISAKCDNQDAEVTYDKNREIVTLLFKAALTPGQATLAIEYAGSLNDKMRGFYRSKYYLPFAPDKECYAAVTQFEPTDARRALPCWDEPSLKATFDVTLVVPRDKVALSNMDVKETREVGEMKEVVFNQTPIMSTYLLAFVVGDFDYVKACDSNGVLVRVYTPVGKKEHGRFALEVAVKTLPFYTEYFNMRYPLSKIDLVTIPDFASIAMENWGLLTFEERVLLVDPDNTSQRTKQYVAGLVGHEIAHQWFGNLVTMEWWTHLWLNEGFAQWIEYLCVDHCHPEYDIWTQFLSKEYSTAMSLDALTSSHPIEVPVGAPSEVLEIFDDISYCKGASIVRMLHNWIGDDAFRKGMNSYLNKFAYKNACTEDLWTALEEVSGRPVADVMSTWTRQQGYPLLTVDTKQEDNKCHITITQRKFGCDGDDTGFEGVIWKVPITVATGRNRQALTFVLESASTTVTVDIEPGDWIKLNPGQVGYYRVRYSPDTFDPLLAALKLSCAPGVSDVPLPPQDRLGLLNDTFTLARSGDSSTVDALRLFQLFSQDTNYTVWENLINNLAIIDRLISNTDFYHLFLLYGERLFHHIVLHLGWETKERESPLDAMLRGLALSQHGRCGNKETIAEAQRRFANHVTKKELLPTNIREAVFGICMANGDHSTFDQLVQLHNDTDSGDEKIRIYCSLGFGKDDSLKKRCLDFAICAKVRAQDSYAPLLSAACSSPRGQLLTWEWFKTNYDKIVECFQVGFILPRVIEAAAMGFIGEDKAREVENFFTTHPLPSAERIVKQCVEAIHTNTQWLERDREAIKNWLHGNH